MSDTNPDGAALRAALQRVTDALLDLVGTRLGDQPGDLAERAAAELDRLRDESYRNRPCIEEVVL